MLAQKASSNSWGFQQPLMQKEVKYPKGGLGPRYFTTGAAGVYLALSEFWGRRQLREYSGASAGQGGPAAAGVCQL